MNETADNAAAVPVVANPFQTGQPAQVALPQTASAASVVQRELGEVQAAVLMAKRYPRDQAAATDRILNACGRISLAQEAMYQYARGGSDIEGPSIRLIEEVARQWGNIACGVIELDRKAGYSEALAYAWDLETNFRDEKRFQVKHWRDTKSGGYQVRDERDIYEVIANQGARRKRACLIAVIPGDVVDAAVEQCKTTLKTKVNITPERIANLVKTFQAEFGVTKEQIEKRLQRRADTITPAQMVQLTKVYNSLRDGMAIVADYFPEATAAGDAPPQATRTEQAKALLAKQAETETPPDISELSIADENAEPPAEWVPPAGAIEEP